MGNKYISEKEIINILNRYKELNYKREVMRKQGIPNFEVDIKLAKEINQLYEDTKKYEKLEIDSPYYKELFFSAYLSIRTIKYKLKFIQLGLIDNKNGMRFFENGNVKSCFKDNVEDIKKLIKDYLKLYNNYCEKPFTGSIVNKSIDNHYKSIMQDLGDLYYFIGDTDNAIKLYNEAFDKYESKHALYMLIIIYTKVDIYEDVSMAEDYYNELEKLPFDDPTNKMAHQLNKFAATRLLYQYYYDNGDYENALIKAQNLYAKCKEYDYIKNDVAFDHEKDALEKINITKNRIDELSKSNISNDILSTYFEENSISLMSNDMKVYIQTSINLYDYFINSNSTFDYDYSSVNIPILKGLEGLLFNIFGEKFFDFIRLKVENSIGWNNKEDSPWNNINDFYLKTKIINNILKVKLKTTVDQVEFGTAKYIACDVERDNSGVEFYTPTLFFQEFCKDVCMIENPDEFIIDFVTNLEKIRKIRNKTAHKNRIDRQDADECRELLYLVTKFIDTIYSKFHIVFENNEQQN